MQLFLFTPQRFPFTFSLALAFEQRLHPHQRTELYSHIHFLTTLAAYLRSSQRAHNTFTVRTAIHTAHQTSLSIQSSAAFLCPAFAVLLANCSPLILLLPACPLARLVHVAVVALPRRSSCWLRLQTTLQLAGCTSFLPRVRMSDTVASSPGNPQGGVSETGRSPGGGLEGS